MSRIMKLILTVNEEQVGSLIADLTGRVVSIDFEVQNLVDGRSRPKKGPAKKQHKKNGKQRARRTEAQILRCILALVRKKRRSMSELQTASRTSGTAFYRYLSKLKKDIIRGDDNKWRIKS